MNHLLLYLFVQSNRDRLATQRVVTVRRLTPYVVFALDGPGGPWHLVVVQSSPGPFCYAAAVDPLEGLGDPVLRRIDGHRLQRPSPPPDRVLRLPLAGGPTIVIRLFGSAARIQLVQDDAVIESLDGRGIGRPERLPATPREPLATMPEASLATILGWEGPDPPARRVPGLEPALLTALAGETATEQATAAARFRDGLVAGTTPFELVADGRLGAVCPVPAAKGSADHDHRLGPYTDIDEALVATGARIAGGARDQLLATAAAPLRRRLSQLDKLRTRLEGERARADAHDALRTEADILAAYQSRIRPGMGDVELPDLYHPGQMVRIPLEPGTPVREQIDRRYRRASRLERARAAVRERIVKVERDIDELTRTIDTALATEGLGEAVRMLDASAPAARQTPRAKRRSDTGPSYRRYDLADGWYVLVGRNDRENETLTFKVAAPTDLWLHAQNVPGSHVILKSTGRPGNPPAAVLEAAAGVAAHFSKARHSRLVPVIYTERKYVRKFRGSRPGQVRCEREKTVFAAPALPPPQGPEASGNSGPQGS